MLKRLREPFSGLSHLAGAGLSIAGLVVLVCLSRGEPWRVTAFSIYGATLILLYLASAIYHLVPQAPHRIRQWFALDQAAIVKLMQDSIKAGGLKEFTFDQVLDWKAGEDEDFDGITYQTGIAAYKAETIFGVKTIEAKALISEGKIQKWIWAKSGLEIK